MKNISWNWSKKDYPKSSNLTSFDLFSCGGGTTMGLKLAGYNHLGGVEIDNKLARIYQYNHQPKYFFTEDVRKFNNRTDLPYELYDVDLLTASPPCTTFSMAGNREESWGKSKKFKEGQTVQRLDDLVFEYCHSVNKLRPKVSLMENVQGLISGGAKKYAIEVYRMLEKFGYKTQIFLLNSATMGVPQSRERVFFVSVRNDMPSHQFKFNFNEPQITFKSIVELNAVTNPMWPSIVARWPYIEYGDQNMKFAAARFKGVNTFNSFFSTNILYDDIIPPTLTSSGASVYYNEKRNLSDKEYIRMSTFPSDYNFMGSDVRYICGMSVPPLMIYHITTEIAEYLHTL